MLRRRLFLPLRWEEAKTDVEDHSGRAQGTRFEAGVKGLFPAGKGFQAPFRSIVFTSGSVKDSASDIPVIYEDRLFFLSDAGRGASFADPAGDLPDDDRQSKSKEHDPG